MKCQHCGERTLEVLGGGSWIGPSGQAVVIWRCTACPGYQVMGTGGVKMTPAQEEERAARHRRAAAMLEADAPPHQELHADRWLWRGVLTCVGPAILLLVGIWIDAPAGLITLAIAVFLLLWGAVIAVAYLGERRYQQQQKESDKDAVHGSDH